MFVMTASGSIWHVDHHSLYDHVQYARTSAGLPPFKGDIVLTEAAIDHAYAMARAGTIFHSTNDQLVTIHQATGGCCLGEIVGVGPSTGVVVQGWQESPAHAAILYGDYSRFGLGNIRTDAGVFVVMLVAE